MAFGPDFYEDEPTPAQSRPVKQERNTSGSRVPAASKPKTGAYIGIVIGLLLGVIGMSFGSLIAPDADGLIKLSMFGVAIVGIIVLTVSAKKLKR